MEIAYTKEKLLNMLEEIQEELDALDETLFKSRNQNMQLIEEHITSLNELENVMDTLRENISASQVCNPTDLSPYARKMPLYLNLAK